MKNINRSFQYGTIGDFPSSMGDNSKDTPNKRAEQELRVRTWKGDILKISSFWG